MTLIKKKHIIIKIKNMLKLILFLLTAYGASNIMVFGSIFKKWRVFVGVDSENETFLGNLFGCMMCLPFWWGVILSLTLFSPSLDYIKDINIWSLTIKHEWLSVFFDGCLASGGVWLIHTIQEALESKS